MEDSDLMDKENKNYTELEIYTEAMQMSREIRESVKHMKRYYRFDVGDEIRQMLRDMKYIISDIHSKPNKCKYDPLCLLVDKINHLEIALTDCLEDEALSLRGRYNISLPLQRLDKIKSQAEHWKSYIHDKYVQEV